MAEEKIINNNKATIRISTDRVIKSYYDSSRNIQESETLKYISANLVPFEHDGWEYSFVKIGNESGEKGIVMDFVSGESMAKDVSKDSYFHAGVWLGNYHRQFKESDEKVKSFYDYTLSNLFVDLNKRKIIATDPGGGALKVKNYCFDIQKFFYSAIVSHLKNKSPYNEQCISSFLEGYTINLDFKYDKNYFNRSLKEVLKDSRQPQRVVKYGKVKFYAGYFLTYYFLNFHLRKQLKKIK